MRLVLTIFFFTIIANSLFVSPKLLAQINMAELVEEDASHGPQKDFNKQVSFWELQYTHDIEIQVLSIAEQSVHECLKQYATSYFKEVKTPPPNC